MDLPAIKGPRFGPINQITTSEVWVVDTPHPAPRTFEGHTLFASHSMFHFFISCAMQNVNQDSPKSPLPCAKYSRIARHPTPPGCRSTQGHHNAGVARYFLFLPPTPPLPIGARQTPLPPFAHADTVHIYDIIQYSRFSLVVVFSRQLLCLPD